MIDLSTRLKGVERWIESNYYFVIRSTSRSGKTTCLKTLIDKLNVTGKYYIIYCSLESVKDIVEPEKSIPVIIKSIKDSLLLTDIPHADEFASDIEDRFMSYIGNLELSLMRFSKILDKPLVIFFDAVDCLSLPTLSLFLSNLRSGYNSRTSRAHFVHSVALASTFDIINFPKPPNAVPFNIVAELYTLQSFTQEEITQLYRQHTDETGQVFEEDAIKLVYEQTQGQPWLVNVIANETIVEILQSDYTKPVTVELVNQAIQNFILNYSKYIGSPLERLKEERIRDAIKSLIFDKYLYTWEPADFTYVKDLGLLGKNPGYYYNRPANPIYAEIIKNELNISLNDERI
jgi:AAA+ ATPase superfamily predicted ATPase